ncbi:MAG: hypothetical protein R2724_25460 [Bryobacterales bacterium]
MGPESGHAAFEAVPELVQAALHFLCPQHDGCYHGVLVVEVVAPGGQAFLRCQRLARSLDPIVGNRGFDQTQRHGVMTGRRPGGGKRAQMFHAAA